MQFVAMLFSNTTHTRQLVCSSRPVASVRAAHGMNNKCRNSLWWRQYLTLCWPLEHQAHYFLHHILSVLPLPTSVQFSKSLGDPQSRSERLADEKICCLCEDSNLGSSSPFSEGSHRLSPRGSKFETVMPQKISAMSTSFYVGLTEPFQCLYRQCCSDILKALFVLS
jgi:hypothetical protein